MGDVFRKHPKVAGFLLGAVVLLASGAVLIAWEMGYECIRVANPINDYGGVVHEGLHPDMATLGRERREVRERSRKLGRVSAARHGQGPCYYLGPM